MSSRLISSADLIGAGFNDLADDWAIARGVKKNITAIPGTTFSYLGTLGQLYLTENEDPVEITIKQNLSVMPIGAVVEFAKIGDGDVSFTAEGVVEFVADFSPLTLTNVGEGRKFTKIAENKFLVTVL